MSEELKPTDEQCDRIVALTMDKLAAKGCDQYGDMHALDLNPNIMEHHSLRRSIVRAAYGVGEAEAISAWNRRAQPEPAASADPSRDAYEGCREDLLDWKRRALKAEETCRQLTRALGDKVNGPTFMGEPVLPDAKPSVAPEPVAWRYQDARGHYRYRAYKPGFDVEYAILKPVPLYEAHPPRAPLTEEQKRDLVKVCSSCDGTGKISGLPCAWCMQSAAPAEQEISAEEKFCDGHCSWAEHHPDCSLAAPPAQPIAHLWQHGETGRTRIVMPDQIFTADANWLLVGPMYLHPAAAPADAAPSVAPEPPESTLIALARRCLWIAYVWNDHNFEAAHKCAKEEAEKHGITSIEDANCWIDAHPPRAPLTEEQKRDLVKECDLDWQRGFMLLFDDDPTNRYAVLIEAVEAAHGIGGKTP